MGRKWDGWESPAAFQRWCTAWATEALRVAKPGAHLLAFGGTRTVHRLGVAIEDAGWEIRDRVLYLTEGGEPAESLGPELHWIYGSGLPGFPKSLSVGKAIDKAAGAERTEVSGVKAGHEDFIDRTDAHSAGGRSEGWERDWRSDPEAVRRSHQTFAPATPEAQQWEGWATALKPAHEPIVVARKPLSGTVAQTVLEHGTGALNVDGCRVGTDDALSFGARTIGDGVKYGEQRPENRTPGEQHAAGRWPSNVVLDEEAAAALDEQTGERRSAGVYVKGSRGGSNDFSGGSSSINIDGLTAAQYDDSGGASRFFFVAPSDTMEGGPASLPIDQGADRFRYCAKASRAERDMGLRKGERSAHPTVKPLNLMRWLVRLVTPPGGLVLDPFAGSGTTGLAALREGVRFVGVERDEEYARLAATRLRWFDVTRCGPDDDEATEAVAQREEEGRLF